jgi:iron complex outermembrane recepter protein
MNIDSCKYQQYFARREAAARRLRALGPLCVLFAVPLDAAAQIAQTAQQVDGEQRGLEEVFVTARRRTETLQEVPFAITAVGAAQLEQANITQLQEIDEIIPNVTMQEAGRNNNSRIFIRGIGGGFGGNGATGVGLYLDGAYMSRNIGTYMSTMEIERIEVLRGPQGTLFGTNTTGGAINIVPVRPGPEPAGRATVRMGNFNTLAGQLMLNVPIVENKVFARFGANVERGDGYYINTRNGEDYNNLNNNAASAAVRFLPNDNWTVDVFGMYVHEPERSFGGECLYNGPSADNPVFNDENNGPYNAGLLAQIEAACRKNEADGPHRFSSEQNGFSTTTQYGAFGTAVWDSHGQVGIFDNLSVTTKANWRRQINEFVQEQDYTDARVFTLGGGSSAVQKSAELVVQFANFNDRLETTFGAYYFHENVRPNGNVECRISRIIANGGCLGDFHEGIVAFEIYPEAAFFGQFANDVLLSEGDFGETYAAFGHVTLKLTDHLAFDAGVRYTEDTLKFHEVDAFLCPISAPDPFGGGSAIPSFSPMIRIIPGVIDSETGVPCVDGGFAYDRSDQDTWTATNPMASLSYKFAPNNEVFQSGNLYVTYAQGYLRGGFNSEVDPVAVGKAPGDFSFGPEQVDSYEVGFKSSWFERRLEMNLAVFRMEYKDKQEIIAIDPLAAGLPGSAGTIQFIDNVAKAEIEGVELELFSEPIDGLQITATYGYLKNEYSEFNTFDADLGAVIDQTGLRINDFSPDHTASGSVQYTYQLAGGGSITPRLQVYYQSEYDYSAGLSENSPPTRLNQEAYSKWDGRLTWEDAQGKWQVSLWAKNLLDEEIIVDGDTNGGGFFVMDTYQLAPPRTYGLEASYNW